VVVKQHAKEVQILLHGDFQPKNNYLKEEKTLERLSVATNYITKLFVQNNLACHIKEEAERRGLYGTCWVLVLPKTPRARGSQLKISEEFAREKITTPTLALVGDRFFHKEDGKGKNFIGIGAAKMARMIATGDKSSFVPKDHPTAEGENDHLGGKICKTKDYYCLIALSTNEPAQNDEIVAQAFAHLHY
jgi:hypothetical protein